jgi:hypothetical protein
MNKVEMLLLCLNFCSSFIMGLTPIQVNAEGGSFWSDPLGEYRKSHKIRGLSEAVQLDYSLNFIIQNSSGEDRDKAFT